MAQNPWVKGNQFCSNEGPVPFLRGDNNEIAANRSQNLKYSPPEPLWQFQINLDDGDPSFFQRKGPTLFQGDVNEIAKIHVHSRNKKNTQEPMGQFQPNLIQNILRQMRFNFARMQGFALFQREIRTKDRKYINEI